MDPKASVLHTTPQRPQCIRSLKAAIMDFPLSVSSLYFFPFGRATLPLLLLFNSINVGVAVEISLPSCIEAKFSVVYEASGCAVVTHTPLTPTARVQLLVALLGLT